jgi:serine/threonine-protein kinase
MNSLIKQPLVASCDRETVDHVPATGVEQRPAGRAAGNGNPGSGTHRTKEAQPLVCWCLGAAALTSWFPLAVFALRDVVAMVLAYMQFSAAMPMVDFMQYFPVIVGVLSVAVFGSRRRGKVQSTGFEAGQLGAYRLISLLRAGGMGEVYVAEHCLLDRPCAIKVIRPERAGDATALARFEREVRMTARLSHWNTVDIFDYGRTADGTSYYVMEYLPGLSLEEMVQRHGPLPAERVVHFLRQACRALREAHSIGLVHRDIKSDNFVVAQCGGVCDVVKLIDFGLVKAAAETPSARLPHEGGLSGTPLFMSPEQARAFDDVDARSDIYSLGAVAYALLTGRPPFERSGPLELLIAHARDEVTPPSLLRADVPADLEKAVLRCLAKKPGDRYQDMDDLEQALARCAAADRWTQACAARWWQDNARGSTALNRAEDSVGVFDPAG